jgi:hypothetical protein
VSAAYADYSLKDIDGRTCVELLVEPEAQALLSKAIADHPLSSRPLTYMKKAVGVKKKPDWIDRINNKGFLEC